MKIRISILLACLALSGCAGGPSQGKAQDAFLEYMKSSRSEDATLTKFELGECKQAQGQPGYNCVVATNVQAIGGRFNMDMSGVYTFGKSDGKWRVLGVVSLSM